MKVTKINETLYQILPEKGMHLTQSSLQEDETRNFCCSAYELTEEYSSKWIEWTEEQKVQYEAENVTE